MSSQAARPKLSGIREENRKQKRAPKRLMVRFGTRGPEKTAFTKNISETGVYLATNAVYQPGSTIEVTIHFPERTWTFWAKVAWAKKVPANLAHVLECGMGVHFVEPGEEWVAFFTAWKERNRVG
jgi:Tfp pilus assembly protein PilZ